MSNELTMANTALTLPTDRKVTLVDVRMDKKNYPCIKSYAPEVATKLLTAIVMSACDLKGISAENAPHIASALYDEIMADEHELGVCNLSFLEINHAVKRGVLTTEMFGVSVATLYKAIVDWIKAEGLAIDKEAKRRYRELKRQQMEQSPAYPMIQAMAGAMARNTKNR